MPEWENMPEWKNRYADIETRVGNNGYWAKRKTKYGYILVKADRSALKNKSMKG